MIDELRVVEPFGIDGLELEIWSRSPVTVGGRTIDQPLNATAARTTPASRSDCGGERVGSLARDSALDEGEMCSTTIQRTSPTLPAS